MTTFLERFATHGQFSDDAAPVVFDLLVKAGLISAVTRNQNIPFETAKSLLAGNISAGDAKNLLAHPWSSDDIDVLLRMEQRRSVITHTIKRVPLSDSTLEYLLGYKHVKGLLADDVRDHQQMSEEKEHRFALLSQRADRVRAVAASASDPEGVDALKDLLRREADIYVMRRTQGLPAALAEAVAEHPEVLELIDEGVTLSDHVGVAFASCIYLTDAQRQLRLANLSGAKTLGFNEMIVPLCLSVNPYLTRVAARGLLDELAVRKSSAVRLPKLVRQLTHRLEENLFLEPASRVRDCPSDMFRLLFRHVTDEVGRVRSREVLVELSYHADVIHDEAQVLVGMLSRFDNADVTAAVEALSSRFPKLMVYTGDCDSNLPSRAARAHKENTNQRLARNHGAGKILSDVMPRRPAHMSYVTEYVSLARVASQRFGADSQKWQTFITLVPNFDETIEQLFTVCDVL